MAQCALACAPPWVHSRIARAGMRRHTCMHACMRRLKGVVGNVELLHVAFSVRSEADRATNSIPTAKAALGAKAS